MKRFSLEGVIPAMLTPFTRNGARVDYDRAAALGQRLADQGVHGVFLCGTTGEGLLMTVEERKRVLETVLKAVGKRIKVLAHTGCLDTASTIALTRHAAEVGAYAAGIVAPGFYTYDDGALLRFYQDVAASVPGFPVMLYNLPSCAKNVLSPALVARLATEVTNIAGIKDSGGMLQHQNRMVIDTPDDFVVINGCDEFTFHALMGGANGSVSSTANVIPEVFLSIFNAVKAGHLKKAQTSQSLLSHATQVFHYGAMVAYYKEGLRLRGFDPGAVRPPQRELTSKEKKAFADELAALGLV